MCYVVWQANIYKMNNIHQFPHKLNISTEHWRLADYVQKRGHSVLYQATVVKRFLYLKPTYIN